MNASSILTQQHRACDQRFAACEAAVRGKDWNTLTTAFAAFSETLERHFTLEENVLFPAFEEATGIVQGPTTVMRMEHQEMRELLEDMHKAARRQDRNQFLDLGETLLILNQQHNMKEENMLYPMFDAHVPDIDSLLQAQHQGETA
jgi:hemerythrin-like domain-containing protein